MMSENQNSLECNTVCWCVAAVVGFVSMLLLYWMADFSGMQAIFTGGLIGLLLGVVLSIFLCRGQKAATDLAGEKPAQRYARQAAEDKAKREAEQAARGMGGSASAGAGAASADSSTSSSSASASAQADSAEVDTSSDAAASSAANEPSSLMSSAVSPSKDLPGEAELAARKGEWKYEGDVSDTADASGGGDASGGSDGSEASESASDSRSGGGSGDDTAEAEPELYTSAPSEGADNLKLISGVGPKLEQTLNELGIYRFAQVADWGPAEIAWVDNRLRFKGRIERDDWMSQAKILAEGGETEFSKRNK